MTTICQHPNCRRETRRTLCGRHFHALSDDLKYRLNRVSKKDPSALGALMVEIRDYFDERMIGDLEIVLCSGRPPDYKGCGADIVWLVTAAGKFHPVNAETVSKGMEYHSKTVKE